MKMNLQITSHIRTRAGQICHGAARSAGATVLLTALFGCASLSAANAPVPEWLIQGSGYHDGQLVRKSILKETSSKAPVMETILPGKMSDSNVDGVNAVAEHTFDLAFDVTYSEEEFVCYGNVVRNQEGSMFTANMETGLFQVPEGVYDIVFYFYQIETGLDYYVIREQVEVSSDMVIPVDVKEADIEITFSDTLPDGESVTPWTLRLQEDYYTLDVLKQGNMTNPWYDVTNNLAVNGYNCIVSGGNMPGNIYYPNGSVMWDFGVTRSIHLNKVSSRVSISHVELFTYGGNLNLVETYWAGGDPTAVTNAGNDVMTYSPEFANEVLEIDDDVYNTGDFYKYLFSYAFTGNGGFHQLSASYPEFEHLTVSKGSSYAQNQLMFRFGRLDSTRLDEFGWPMSSYVLTNSIGLSDEGHFRNMMRNNLYTYGMRDNSADFSLFMANPFSYDSEDCVLTNGASCPFFRAAECMVFGTCYFNLNSIGLIGEERQSDYASSEVVRITVDGSDMEEVPELSSTGQLVLPNAQVGQKWELEIVNGNINVDGIPGYSEISAAFTIGEECPVPIVQQVQILNASGVVTNLLTSPEEGVLNIALGTFSFHSYMPAGEFTPTTWYECSPELPEYTVSYAPYNSGEWKELEMEEIFDKYYPDGMGHFLTASLKGIDTVSDTGWYDLLISLKDKTGNTTVQKFGPVFKIQDPSSVKSVADLSSLIRGGHGSIIRPDEAVVYDINGIKLSGNHFNPGIYIVRYGTSAVKVTVR